MDAHDQQSRARPPARGQRPSRNCGAFSSTRTTTSSRSCWRWPGWAGALSPSRSGAMAPAAASRTVVPALLCRPSRHPGELTIVLLPGPDRRTLSLETIPSMTGPPYEALNSVTEFMQCLRQAPPNRTAGEAPRPAASERTAPWARERVPATARAPPALRRELRSGRRPGPRASAVKAASVVKFRSDAGASRRFRKGPDYTRLKRST